MKRVLVAPGKIVIGSGVLAEAGDYIKSYGAAALLIALEEDHERVRETLDGSAREYGVRIIFAPFGGECSYGQIEELEERFADSGADVVLGLGGGKAIDAAKIYADRQGLPFISVPTVASTDAPCSAWAIMYDENHIHKGGRLLKSNPQVVLVDSGIIARAPERFLVAGMGDAYSTYFEARACRKTGVLNNGGLSTISAFALAELSCKTLLEKGEAALQDCRAGVVTPALEDVIEANIVMSGIGFESVGVAAAHGLLRTFEVLGADEAMHGEIVAFGTLVQLVLENAPEDEIQTTIDFFSKVSLPVRLSDLGIKNVSCDLLKEAAEHAFDKPALIRNMPFEITQEMICEAILRADSLTGDPDL